MTVTTETNITGSSNQGGGGGSGDSAIGGDIHVTGGGSTGDNNNNNNTNTNATVDTDGGNLSLALPSNAHLSSAGSLPPTFHDPSASVLRRHAAASEKSDDGSRNASPLSGGDDGSSAAGSPLSGVGLWNRLQKQPHPHPQSPSTPDTGGTFGSSDQGSNNYSFVGNNNDNTNHLQQPIIGLTHNIVSSHELSSSDRNHVSQTRTTTTTTTAGGRQKDSGTVAESNGPTSWNEMYASYTDPSRPKDGSDGISRDRIENIRRILRVSNAITEVTNADIERVRMMYRRFYEGSILCFNYNCLLGISSIIAALGLAADSSATIIASMLVSPLMGPVVGMAYGQSIGDTKLTRTALKTELISLAVCVVTGMTCGICMAPFEVASTWPTSEMLSRSTLTNLYFGIPIAFFSGLGVAVSLLDDQTSSLVGVAISASLLPPAVNAGLLLINAFIYEREEFTDPNYDREFFYKGGAVSFGLTLVNIVLIIISSMIMFRVKERLPIRRKKIFWTDLGLARKIYSNKAIKKQESINFDTPNPVVNQAKAVGKRVSTFITSPFVAYTNNGNTSDVDNNDQLDINDASIPHGTTDQLHTVIETIAEDGRESELSKV